MKTHSFEVSRFSHCKRPKSRPATCIKFYLLSFVEKETTNKHHHYLNIFLEFLFDLFQLVVDLQMLLENYAINFSLHNEFPGRNRIAMRKSRKFQDLRLGKEYHFKLNSYGELGPSRTIKNYNTFVLQELGKARILRRQLRGEEV